jgi:hypothetical protein
VIIEIRVTWGATNLVKKIKPREFSERARVIALCVICEQNKVNGFLEGLALGCSLMHSLRGMDVNAAYGCVYIPPHKTKPRQSSAREVRIYNGEMRRAAEENYRHKIFLFQNNLWRRTSH